MRMNDLLLVKPRSTDDDHSFVLGWYAASASASASGLCSFRTMYASSGYAQGLDSLSV